jgi:hypothetical protein
MLRHQRNSTNEAVTSGNFTDSGLRRGNITKVVQIPIYTLVVVGIEKIRLLLAWKKDFWMFSKGSVNPSAAASLATNHNECNCFLSWA